MLTLSILIPTYNGERYIRRCLDSIIFQDYPHEKYDIICLDDCSKDNTFSILKSYQERYDNVKVFKNKKNLRVASSMNRLLCLAEGEYLWHVDQDDIVEDGALKRIVEDNLISRNLDILLFNYHRVSENETILDSPVVFQNVGVSSGANFIRQQFKSRDYCQYLLGYDWRGVSRRSIWENNRIRCIDGINYEDTIIMLKALIYSQRVSSISDFLYKYRVNDGSITYNKNFIKSGRFIYEYAFEVGREVEQCYDEMKVLYPDLAMKLHMHLIERYNNFIFDLIRTSISEKKTFYSYVCNNKSFIDSKKRYLNWKSRLFLFPLVGFLISAIGQWLYRSKKALF